MIKKNLAARLPCESAIVRVHGEKWREFPSRDLDGAWGVAIVRSVLDGVSPSLHDLGFHLGVHSDCLRTAFMRLSMNGVFLRDRIYNDRKALNCNDLDAWCQYAGIASGATGNVGWEPRKRKEDA